jgi:hypothetical protein
MFFEKTLLVNFSPTLEIRKNSVWEGRRFIEKRIKAILGQKSWDTVFGLQAAAVSYVYQVLHNQCKKKSTKKKIENCS